MTKFVPKRKQKTFHINWSIELDATNPMEAAKIAREIQLDPNSLATVFTIDDLKGQRVVIDYDPYEVKEYKDSRH